MIREAQIGDSWYRADTRASGTVTFEDGPAGPPLGVGSVELQTTAATADKAQLLTDDYDGVLVSDIQALRYDAYRSAAPVGSPASAALNLRVDTDGDGFPDSYYVFEPYQDQGNAAVLSDVWQTWNATRAGAARWWVNSIVSGPCSQATPCAFSDLQALFPLARLADGPTSGGTGDFPGSLGFNLGSFNPSVTVNVDALTVTVAGATTTYDFEPTPPRDDFTLSIDDAQVVEGNSGTTNLVFTISLNRVVEADELVQYAFNTEDRTAEGGPIDSGVLGPDYRPGFSDMAFAPGEISRTLEIPVRGETVVEADETMAVILGSPNASGGSAITITDGEGIGTITNDDVAPPVLPTLSINDTSVTEGNSGTQNATFTVSLSAPSATTVTVKYATSNGTASSSSDYTAKNGTVTFTPGQTTRPVTVSVKGDTTVESDETFKVTLTQPTNATIADNQGLGTIVNNDFPKPYIRIADVSISEGRSGTTNMLFRLNLSSASNVPVSVKYATVNGTAKSGSDFVAASGTATFPAGQTQIFITVKVNGDRTREPNETMSVSLSNPTNGIISDAVGQGVIRNDD